MHFKPLSDEAHEAFSAATQMHDTLVKAWALWGEYLEAIFVQNKVMKTGASAITCFLHACRHQNEPRSRKYLAKVLWLLSYDDDEATLASTVDKYCVGVPPVRFNVLMRRDSHIGRKRPSRLVNLRKLTIIISVTLFCIRKLFQFCRFEDLSVFCSIAFF